MASIYRLNKSKLSSRRLDAWHYQPSFEVELDKIEKTIGLSTLEDNIDVARGVAGGATPLGANYLNIGRVKFYRTSEVDNLFLDSDSAVFISNEDDEKLKRSRLKKNDILLTITGAKFGKSAVVNSKHLPGNISQHSVRFSPKPNIDSYWLIAYLNCKFGQISIWKEAYGATRPAIDFPSIRSLAVPQLKGNAQIYIGNKVRQAELLSLWAKQLLKQANDEFERSIFWDPRVVKRVKFGRVAPDKLENRLDHRFNSIEKFKAIDLLVENDIKLEQLENVYSITAMVGWKGLTTDHYVDDGPWLLRGVEFSDGVIDFDNLVMVERGKYLEQPQIHLKEGDVALSKDGTIGKAIVIPEINREFAVGSTIARLRKIDETLDPYYLEHCLNHDFLQVQIESYATGVAQPHITQEWIAKLLIPRVANEQEISTLIYKHHLAMNLAKALTNSSKRLVEALIESQITENQLIEAQQALEAGDNTKDRAILSKLTDKGYLADDGKPLFTDLGKLHELLGEAKVAVDANEESV